jgi:SprT-like family
MMSYRDAAVVLWGDAGAYAHEAYARIRAEHYVDLPEQLPIVIGLTAYGRCIGLTRPAWEHGPRISVSSSLFARGRLLVDDTLIHEMLHAALMLAGLNTSHAGDDWYAAVRQLSPAVLGQTLDVRRGADRRSVRVPNPAYTPGNGKPATIVRKRSVEDAVSHADVARWPGSFRPKDHDWGAPMQCPTY